MNGYTIRVGVNGRQLECTVRPQMSLLEFLREQLLLTGTKEGCGNGECGACTVLVDGTPMRSCLMLAVEADGREVTTIEGLDAGGERERIVQAFVEHDAVQCGFCTPGFVIAVKALLDRHPRPTELQLREALSGHLCRCTGYESVLAAVRSLAGIDAGNSAGNSAGSSLGGRAGSGAAQ
jgi:aerobic-type carbon monoxide dehydrogenase small subunit (CoxS/CutS family)